MRLNKLTPGMSLTEVMIASAVTGLVAVGIWQSLQYINKATFRASEQIILSEEIQQLQQVIGLDLGGALDSVVQFGGDCLILLSQPRNSETQQTKVWRIGNADFPSSLPTGLNSVSLFERVVTATEFEQYQNTSITCLSTPLTDSSWRNLSSAGAIQLADKRFSVEFEENHGVVEAPTGWEGSFLSGNQYRTIEFWMKTSESNVALFRHGHETDDSKAIFAFTDGSGQVVAKIGNHRLVALSPTVNDDAWHHIAISYNPDFSADPDDNSPFDIFIDGNKVTGSNKNANASVTGTITANQKLIIGEEGFAWETRNDYEGYLDEFRIWQEGDGADSLTRSAVQSRIESFWRKSQTDTEVEGDLVIQFSFDDSDQDSNGFLAKTGSGSNSRINATSGLSLISGSLSAPISIPFFEVSYGGENRIVESNFWFKADRGTEVIGSTQQKNSAYRSAVQKPVVSVKPSGIIAIPEGGDARIELLVEGSRADFNVNDITFEAVFDPGLAVQGDACTDMWRPSGDCSFDGERPTVTLKNSECRRGTWSEYPNEPASQDLSDKNITCYIKSTGNTSQVDGTRFITARVASDDKSNEDYSHIPGDQFTLQIFEPCTAPSSDNHTTVLLDVGTINDGRFINDRSYLTYSWESVDGERMKEVFDGTGGITYSPDWAMWTRRNAISPVLFRQETSCPNQSQPSDTSLTTECDQSPDGWYFAVGFDRPGSPPRTSENNLRNWYRDMFDDPGLNYADIDFPAYNSSNPPAIPSPKRDVYWIGLDSSSNMVSDVVEDRYTQSSSGDTSKPANFAQACEISWGTAESQVVENQGSGMLLSTLCSSSFPHPGLCTNGAAKGGNQKESFNRWCYVAWEMSNMPVAPGGNLTQGDDASPRWPIWYDESNEFTVPSGTGVPPYGTISAENGWRNGNVDGYVALMTTADDLSTYRSDQTDPDRRNPTFRVFNEGGAGNWFLQTTPYNVPVTFQNNSFSSTNLAIQPGITDAVRFNVSTAISCPYTAPTYTINVQD